MNLVLYIILGIGAAIFFVALIWRLLSRRSSLPCPTWLAWLVELDNPFAGSYSARTIVHRLELRSGMRVLDIGCGPGRVTIPIAQQVGPQGEVVAIDIQPGMLRRADAKAQVAGLTNIKFLQLRVGEGDLGYDQYERALLVTVLGEIPDRKGAMEGVYRALKPGGQLSITEIMVDPHYQGRQTILGLAGPAGFHEKAFFGNRFVFTLILEKPAGGRSVVAAPPI
jgi:SAM-dependent methyltransferase